MKRFTVWGCNKAGFCFRVGVTDSWLWAYIVAYWSYFQYDRVQIFDRRYGSVGGVEMNTKEKIEVMQAWSDGKTVEFRKVGNEDWYKLTYEPDWNWSGNEYRVKREPVECWVVEWGDKSISIRANEHQAKQYSIDYGKGGSRVFKMREVIE